MGSRLYRDEHQRSAAAVNVRFCVRRQGPNMAAAQLQPAGKLETVCPRALLTHLIHINAPDTHTHFKLYLTC